MNVSEINDALFRGEVDEAGVLPHVESLARRRFVFQVEFGLSSLPEEPGIILIRGARQYGKSTWLEQSLKETIVRFGPGTAFYLNGDEIRDADHLALSIRDLVSLYSTGARVRRLFIDEITAVKDWVQVLKRLADAGELADVLVVTTGSRATDLRRGVERLPGRKGRLARTNYLFTPVPFSEFRRVCGDVLGDDAVPTYLLSGGSPVALAELAEHSRLPEFVIEIVRDWIHGECAASGRSRSSLMAVMECVLRRGGSPIGQAKLAREAGLANNTVASGYVELLADLLVLGISHAWDSSSNTRLRRRPAKYPPINLLAAVAWDPARLRSVEDFRSQSPEEQGKWWEWLIAQELWRRSAVAGIEDPELLRHWRSSKHELDFVVGANDLIEVKRGRSGPLDYRWFPGVFPSGRLLVVGGENFETKQIQGVTFETFLANKSGEGPDA